MIILKTAPARTHQVWVVGNHRTAQSRRAALPPNHELDDGCNLGVSKVRVRLLADDFDIYILGQVTPEHAHRELDHVAGDDADDTSACRGDIEVV